MSKFAVLVLAAGRSTRFGGEERKPFVSLGGRAVWKHSVEMFAHRPDVCQTLLVVSPDDVEAFRSDSDANLEHLGVDLCEGGKERADSVRAGLAALSEEATHVAIHDAARPLVTTEEIDAVFAAAIESHAAILAAPVTSTLKRVADGVITDTVSRANLWAAQTPQVFEVTRFREAIAAAGDAAVTDDAQLFERLGKPVTVVEAPSQNLKITTQDDLTMAAAILATRQQSNADR
ncbi:MAG: 2-C-methyl-D-erythritol 4-phosphate cytidylyltransferase [Planctomycetota bacterium]